MTRRRGTRWLGLAMLAAVTACAGDARTLIEPDELFPRAAIDDPGDAFGDSDITKAFVCVVSPVAGAYVFDITGAPFAGSGNPGPAISNNPATIAPGTCEEVATAGAGAVFYDYDSITASENSTPGGATRTNVTVENAWYPYQGGSFGGSTTTSSGNPATGWIGAERATRITFHYSGTGGEGCTPGYWKQEHHFDSWVGYAPGDKFDSVFDDAFGEMTLLEVLKQGGGGLKALGRHTVAALLNAASGINFGWTEQDVIDAFNAVYPGGDYEGLKNELVELNEAGCPLN